MISFVWVHHFLKIETVCWSTARLPAATDAVRRALSKVGSNTPSKKYEVVPLNPLPLKRVLLITTTRSIHILLLTGDHC